MKLNQILLHVIPCNASKKQVLSIMEDIHQQLKDCRKEVLEDTYENGELIIDLAEQQLALQKNWFNNNPNSTMRWYVTFAKDVLKLMKRI